MKCAGCAGTLSADTGLKDLFAMVLVLIRPRLALVAYAYDTVLLQRDRGAAAVMDPREAALGAAERLFELRGFPIVDEEHLVVFRAFDDRRAGTGEQSLFRHAEHRSLSRRGIGGLGGDFRAAGQGEKPYPERPPHSSARQHVRHGHAKEYPRKRGKKRHN